MPNLSPRLAADVDLLNAAIALEQQAIWTYGAAAKTNLLKPEVLDVAKMIAGQHADHEKALSDQVTKMGGTPPKAKDSYNLPALNSQEDILKYALSLEVGAANGYFDVLQKLSDKTLKQLSASIMGDESQHVTVLSSALGMQPFNMTAFLPLKAS
jgi:rubrerythrin